MVWNNCKLFALTLGSSLGILVASPQPSNMAQMKWARLMVVLSLLTGFGYSIIFSLIKWKKGKTGMTQEIRRQENRLLPTVTICRQLALSVHQSKNMTDNYLHSLPIDKHVIHIEHELKLQNGYVSEILQGVPKLVLWFGQLIFWV